MLDRDKTILIVGLGLLGGKYAQVLSGKGYTVWGIDSDPETIQWALDRAYISRGSARPDRELIEQADRIIFGLYPTVLLDWVKACGGWVRPGTYLTDVSGVKRGVVAPVQEMLPQGGGVHRQPSHGRAGDQRHHPQRRGGFRPCPTSSSPPTDRNTPPGHRLVPGPGPDAGVCPASPR